MYLGKSAANYTGLFHMITDQYRIDNLTICIAFLAKILNYITQ